MSKKQAQGHEQYQPADEADLVDQVLGYAPYWIPDEELSETTGNHGKIHAILIGLDDSDPNFERWVFQANHPTLCHRGPNDESQKDIVIQPGGHFSMSKFAQLTLHQYIGLPITLTAVKKVFIPASPNRVPPLPKREMWEWKLQVSKEVARLVQEERARLQAQMLAERRGISPSKTAANNAAQAP